MIATIAPFYGQIWGLLCVALALALWGEASEAQEMDIPNPPQLVCDETGCPAAIANITYNGWDAYQIADTKSYAIVVPAIGRVMAYGPVAGTDYGANWLWNGDKAATEALPADQWKNWGGDKTWLGPQSFWGTFVGNGAWPPDPAWDGQPFTAEVLTGGRLRLTGPVAQRSGTRIIREFWHDEQTGEFVIQQSAEKVSGPPMQLSIWSITQIKAPDAVFIPLNPDSAYKNNFHWIDHTGKPDFQADETMLRVKPSTDGSFKIGADAPVTSIAAVTNGHVFLQRAANAGHDYPDGALGAGFPIELYGNADPNAYYQELELLAPLRRFTVGSRWTYTVRWSLHRLPLFDVDSEAVQDAVKDLLWKEAEMKVAG